MATPPKQIRLKGRQKFSSTERKRRKSESDRQRQRSRINIGTEIDRWNSLKDTSGSQNNEDFARLLLNCYSDAKKQSPATSSNSMSEINVTGVSELSLPGTSGLQKYTRGPTSTSTPALHPRLKALVESESDVLSVGTTKKRERKEVKLCSSFVDPFELSIDVYEESDSERSGDMSDEEYEPSVDIYISPMGDDIEEMSFAEEVFGREIETGEEDTDADNSTPSSGVTRLRSLEEGRHIVDEMAYLCYVECLVVLAKTNVPKSCLQCSSDVSISTSQTGTALYLIWSCTGGHVAWRWCSQPLLQRGLNVGDLMTSAAILFSGNNYQKVKLMFQFLNTGMVSQSSFLRMQRTYLIPAVESYWVQKQTQVFDNKRGLDVVVLASYVFTGDGRMDSPGHCAQYCTYTAMDNTTKEVISVMTVDKREVGKSSVRMEKEAFLRTMAFLDDKKVNVCEVVTDAHSSIAAHMRKEIPQIKHSFDVWHAAKNLAKKIMKAAQQRGCGELKTWCKHIVNHFYHACDVASPEEEFLGIWFGVLHHTINEHEWLIDCGGGVCQCVHGPLTEPRETEWLTAGSPPHEALRSIVKDRYFQANIPYYLNARSTAELEEFNNLILMYAGKRFSYTPPVDRARNILAAFDHNSHLDRQHCINKDGTARVAKVCNKKSNRWTLRQEKEAKTYPYKKELMLGVLEKRLGDRQGMFQAAELSPTDPRRLSKTIAPLEPPSKEQLLAEHRARIGQN